jgi:hypothetical protein
MIKFAGNLDRFNPLLLVKEPDSVTFFQRNEKFFKGSVCEVTGNRHLLDFLGPNSLDCK